VFGSIKIGNAFGIPVRIHLTFLLLAYGVFVLAEDAPLALGIMGLTFGCVLLHELGHSLVARGFGLKVADITLWPLGGIARMSEIPENARIEGLIAIAGPAVNFALAGLALVVLLAAHAFGLGPGSGADRWLGFFLAANVVQGGFNLLPAFPMDGGRLLRAFFGRKGDWLGATERAVRVGRAVAFLFLAGSLWLLAKSPHSLCLLPLVALFIWFEGTRELWSVRLRHGVLPFGAAARFAGRPAESTSGAAPPAAPPESAPGEKGAAQRPLSWTQPTGEKSGFSEEQVRWLEAHRGPLRRPPPDGA
jgi:Zn-dependent protease